MSVRAIKVEKLQATEAESCDRECLGSVGCTSEPVSLPLKGSFNAGNTEAKTLSAAVTSPVLRAGVTWAHLIHVGRGIALLQDGLGAAPFPTGSHSEGPLHSFRGKQSLC